MECCRGGKALLPLLYVVGLWLLWTPVRALAAGELPPASMLNYCSQPPFSSAGIKSNVLLMLDNSASMYDPAYTQKYCSGSSVTCGSNADCPTGQTCDAYAYCIDSSYQDGSTYHGYFDPGSIYSYDTAKGAFLPGATLPTPPCSSSSCAASTSFLYVEIGSASSSYPFTRPVNSFRASGNFLNWLAMSKLDLEKRVLTGGKFQPDPSDTQTDPAKKKGWLQGESRGCQGKRFVKLVDGLPITFAVHGPLNTDFTNSLNWDYAYDGGGASFIEIYDRTYNKSACLAAVNAWRSDSKATVVTQANACMGTQEEMGPNGILMSSRGQIYNHVMGDCYDYLVNKVPLGYDDELQQMCKSRAVGLFGVSEMWKLTQQQWNSFDGICGRGVLHTPLSFGPVIDDMGFFGSCYSSTGAGDSQCMGNELVAYCNQINLPLVQDPSTVSGSGTPGFIMEAGTSNLGGVSGKFNVRAYVAEPPSGLIQELKNTLNFGVMVFSNGAGDAECSSGKVPCVGYCTGRLSRQCKFDTDCQELVAQAGKGGLSAVTKKYGTCAFSNRDGGKILSYLNDDASPVGDHSTGLIAAIDGITAANWTPFAESFYSAIGYFAQRTDLRLTSFDFDSGKPAPSKYSCQRNNILIVSDGMSSADSNQVTENFALLYKQTDAQLGQDTVKMCPPFSGSRSLDDLAWIAANRNIKTLTVAAPASTELPAAQDQSITTHVVFTGTSNGAPGECDPVVLMQQTAARGGGIFANNSDPGMLYQTLKGVLLQIAEGTASGSDPSVVPTGNGNGALFLAEQYFPRKSFDKGQSSAAWIGEMQSLWYYIDPFLQGTGSGSTVREDSDGDYKLNLKNDRAVNYQDAASLFYDGNGDGSAEGATESLPPDKVKALWRAGVSLWRRSPADRKIFTTLDGKSRTDFSKLVDAAPEAAPKLLQAADGDEASRIISYITGVDSAGYRSRLLSIPADTVAGVSGGTSVWKLGDIISSTARLQSSSALGSYHLAAPGGYNDLSYRSFITSKEYKNRGTVYVGANDGMLHAFNAGRLDATASGDVKAKLDPKENQTSSDFGKEQWAFIPRNALPYLTYLKEPLYQHIYYLDGPLTLLDASIGDTGSGSCVKGSYWKCPKHRDESVQNSDGTLNSAKNTWRTVLIGGMGLGGATGECGSSSPECVPTPIPDPADSSRRVGYSSYFALDVTDPEHPALLWEFSHPELGFTTTGPAIVRLGGAEVNGRWLAVFGSGPTGPVRDGQFLGHSGRELKFFVVDLRTGALVTTITTGIDEAFAGSLGGGAIDLDRRDPGSSGYYQDDILYCGYVAKDRALKTWTRGGVGRIIIDNEQLKENEPVDDRIRSIWRWSRVLGHPEGATEDPVGPVTTGIARLIDTRHDSLWLYFGTGRYFYRLTDEDGDTTGFSRDDWKGARAIYGVKDSCYKRGLDGKFLDKDCSEVVSGVTDQTESISAAAKGWKIRLDQGTDPNGAERVITSPVSTTGGAVFFASYQPTLTPCLPGSSYLWGVRFDTGDTLPAGSVKGKAILQLSSGRPAEAGLSSGQRRSGPLPGRPVGLKVVSNSGLKPVKKIIHIQER